MAERKEKSMLSENELARELKSMYENAPSGHKTTMILLFGIKFSEDLKYFSANNGSIERLCKNAIDTTSYQTEVHKGIRLSGYVCLK